jgi:urease accessory protein
VTTRTLRAAAFACACAIAMPALSHPGDATHGLNAGFAHPFHGLDHLLAMIAVGLWAARRAGAALWAAPLAFVAAMLAGGLLGFADIVLPLLELGVAGSVLVLGLLLALPLARSIAGACLAIALFGIFHGAAHGTELPAGQAALPYALGFLTASVLLHLGAIAVGRLVRASALRYAGGVIAAAGGLLLAGGLG